MNPWEDPNALTPALVPEQRGTVLPFLRDQTGATSWAWPSIIHEPAMSWKRLMDQAYSGQVVEPSRDAGDLLSTALNPVLATSFASPAAATLGAGPVSMFNRIPRFIDQMISNIAGQGGRLPQAGKLISDLKKQGNVGPGELHDTRLKETLDALAPGNRPLTAEDMFTAREIAEASYPSIKVHENHQYDETQVPRLPTEPDSPKTEILQWDRYKTEFAPFWAKLNEREGRDVPLGDAQEAYVREVRARRVDSGHFDNIKDQVGWKRSRIVDEPGVGRVLNIHELQSDANSRMNKLAKQEFESRGFEPSPEQVQRAEANWNNLQETLRKNVELIAQDEGFMGRGLPIPPEITAAIRETEVTSRRFRNELEDLGVDRDAIYSLEDRVFHGEPGPIAFEKDFFRRPNDLSHFEKEELENIRALPGMDQGGWQRMLMARGIADAVEQNVDAVFVPTGESVSRVGHANATKTKVIYDREAKGALDRFAQEYGAQVEPYALGKETGRPLPWHESPQAVEIARRFERDIPALEQTGLNPGEIAALVRDTSEQATRALRRTFEDRYQQLAPTLDDVNWTVQERRQHFARLDSLDDLRRRIETLHDDWVGGYIEHGRAKESYPGYLVRLTPQVKALVEARGLPTYLSIGGAALLTGQQMMDDNNPENLLR